MLFSDRRAYSSILIYIWDTQSCLRSLDLWESSIRMCRKSSCLGSSGLLQTYLKQEREIDWRFEWFRWRRHAHNIQHGITAQSCRSLSYVCHLLLMSINRPSDDCRPMPGSSWSLFFVPAAHMPLIDSTHRHHKWNDGVGHISMQHAFVCVHSSVSLPLSLTTIDQPATGACRKICIKRQRHFRTSSFNIEVSSSQHRFNNRWYSLHIRSPIDEHPNQKWPNSSWWVFVCHLDEH